MESYFFYQQIPYIFMQFLKKILYFLCMSEEKIKKEGNVRLFFSSGMNLPRRRTSSTKQYSESGLNRLVSLSYSKMTGSERWHDFIIIQMLVEGIALSPFALKIILAPCQWSSDQKPWRRYRIDGRTNRFSWMHLRIF